MPHDFDDGFHPGSKEYYDDLGGAYYSADDKESFEPRTPNGRTGCMILLPVIFFLYTEVW